MLIEKHRPLGLAASCVIVLVASSATLSSAAALTWDSDTTPAAAGVQDGSGTWTNGGTNWYDGTANVGWNNATPDSATIGVSGTGTITLGGPITAGSVSFGTAYGLNLAGNTLTTGGIVYTGAGAPNINNGTASTAASVVDTVTSGTSTYLGKWGFGNASGATVALTKNGAGTQAISTQNLPNAITINGGTLQFNTQNTVGSGMTPTITLNNGSTFKISNVNDTSSRVGKFTGAFNIGSGDTSFIEAQDNTSYTVAVGVNGAINNFSRTAGATINFVTSGVGASITANTNSISFVGEGSFYNGADYAYTSSGFVLTAPAYGTTTGFSNAGSALVASAHNLVASSITGQVTASTNTIKFVGSSAVNLGLASGATLTVGTTTSTAGLLRSGGGATTISGGTAIKPFAAAELVVRADAAADSITFTTPVIANGTNAFTKSGAGTVTLGGANTYTGGTFVDGGTLLVNGSTVAASAVSVQNGGKLGGSGTIGGAVTLLAGSGLTPGNATQTLNTLTTGAMDISAAAAATGAKEFVFDLLTQSTSDKVSLSGLNIGSQVLNFDDFTFNALSGITTGPYTLFHTIGGISGLLGSSNIGSINASYNGALSLSGGDLILTVSSVPEPTTLATLAVAGLGMLRRRRRTA